MNTDKAVGPKALSEQVIGAAYEVSNTLGCGYFEKVYENALALELRYRGHAVEQQREMPVYYREQLVGMYQADLVIDDQLVIELKAVHSLDPVHRAQCLNYLRASGKSLGLLINFGRPHVDVQRIQSFA
jgi:GxxExxY protein